MDTVDNAFKDWCFKRVLGTGSFGIIELWSNNCTGLEIGKTFYTLTITFRMMRNHIILTAIKKCKRSDEELTQVQKQRWIQEVEIMKRLNHPNIVETSHLSFLPKHSTLPILFMEFCRKGDLRKVYFQ